MEQDREPKNKPHIRCQLPQRSQEHKWGKGSLFNKWLKTERPDAKELNWTFIQHHAQKDQLKMDQRLICKIRKYKTPRGKHRGKSS